MPRLATHGWVLALALLVLGLAPLAMHHPITDVSATGLPGPALSGPNSADEATALPSRIDHVDRVPVAAPASAGRERMVRFIWPTHGVITQPFWQFHPGIDIANVIGTPEIAADAGKVIWAGWGDYGIYVEIDHGNGFVTIYAHMSQVLVSDGQLVRQGQLLGLMGETGRATGPHLHFEIRYNGVPQNPLDLLPPSA